MICNDCAIKVDNFHSFALFAQKNQEIFTRINAEKVYQEHCKSLSSLNTTLYRETSIQQSPPLPQSVIHSPPLHPHQVEVASTEDITIFAYNDLKLGQLIKDIELLKLILRALKWKELGETLDQKLDRLRNTSFRAVLSSPDLLQDEDLVLLLGPYLDKSAFGGAGQKQQQQQQQSQQMYNDSNAVTEMEVGVDPELFFYDDDEQQSAKEEDIHPMTTPMVSAPTSVTTAAATTTTPPTATIQAKRTRKIVPKKRTPKSKATAVPPPLPPPVLPIPPVVPPSAIVETISAIKPAKSKKKKNVSVSFLLPEPTPSKSEGTVTVKKMEDLMKPVEAAQPITAPAAATIFAGEAPATATSPKKTAETPQLVQRILQKSKETLKHTKLSKKDEKSGKKTKTRARVVLNLTPSLKCTVCNKKFSTKGNLTAHMRTHKVKGKFTCDKCGRM